MGAKSANRLIRDRLYEGLFKVEAYAAKPSKREDLELLTRVLHSVSQDADFLFASIEESMAVLQAMQSSHQRFQSLQGVQSDTPQVFKVNDSIEYLLRSVHGQRLATLSYKSRKDIAMNLVSDLSSLSLRYENPKVHAIM